MRILDTLTFLLVTMIFRSVVADDLPAHLDFFGFVNTTIEDIEEFDIELCEKNGGPGTHAAHNQSRVRFYDCMRTATEPEFEEERRLASLQRIPSVDNITRLYQSYCRRIPEMENCLIDLTDSMKTCLDPDKHESADIAYDIISKIGRLLCKDNAVRLLKFITSPTTRDCMHPRFQAVENCANRTLGNYVKSIVSHGAEFGGLGGLHLLVPDSNKCSVFDKFQDCAIRELKSCSDPSAGSIFNSMFNIVKDVANCKRFLNSHASPASPANVLLITAGLTTILLRFV